MDPIPEGCNETAQYLLTMTAHKLFDAFSDWSKDAILEPNKVHMMTTSTMEAHIAIDHE
ncbi:hypothetical protein RND71_023024 [Anisodus tanguticus]|uniref:Uncharacterized protein n=1 Tax=Anisodus tanguticus TaxID=243964 RepID=A0AAE1VDF7_9SOLA|nr:hypothetical protein RND71_023024 [Anisodus tanguticus]